MQKLSKRIQVLGSESFMRSLAKIWQFLPNDFAPFHKDCSFDFSELQSHTNRLSQIGCVNLARSSSELIKRFYDAEEFYGYKRISPVDSAMVLAKKQNLFFDEISGLVLIAMGSSFFRYEPKVVPIHLIPKIPEQVMEKISDVFDNYLLVVPFLGSKVLTQDKTLGTNFPECEDFHEALGKGVFSVLLGEREGMCYFICEWN
jgi:hypothetical protein